MHALANFKGRAKKESKQELYFQHRHFCKGKTKTKQRWATSRGNCVPCNFIHRSAILSLFAGWGVPEPQCSL